MFLHDKRMELFPATKRKPNNAVKFWAAKPQTFTNTTRMSTSVPMRCSKKHDCLKVRLRPPPYTSTTPRASTMKRTLKGDEAADSNARSDVDGLFDAH